MIPCKLTVLTRLGLLLCLPGLVGWSPLVRVIPTASPSLVSVTFPPTTDRGAPERSTGGGTRRGGTCGMVAEESVSETLIALAPSNNAIKTLAPNPSIYIYVPSFPEKEARFQLFDRDRKVVIYEETLTLTGESGLLKISLPTTVALMPETQYEWSFSVICNPDDFEQDRFVEGWIERVPLDTDIQAQVDNIDTPLDKAQIYATQELWYETLEILLSQRDENPTAWLEFVNSVNLSPEIASSPVVEF